jgi:hypothetical protein
MVDGRGSKGQPPRGGLARLPIHPLFAAAYPVLFLFGANAADQVTADALWEPLALAVSAAAALVVVLAIGLRDASRAGLVATLLVSLFFWYGHVRNLVAGVVTEPVLLLALWLAAGAVALVAILRWARPVAGRLTSTLNLAIGLLVVLNAGGIATYMLGGAAPLLPAPAGIARGAAEDGTRPDIWYLIFDRYGSSPVLDRYYGWDNRAFSDALRERGFYVADESQANYPKTPLSLVSSLSMAYLDREALAERAASGTDAGPIHRLLRGPLPVPSALRDAGYRHVQVANWWEPTATNATADLTLRYESASEFSQALLKMTVLNALDGVEDADPFDRAVLREHTLFQFDALTELAAEEGPKLVFAHFLVPHPPYVFEADGSWIPKEPTGADAERRAYVEQLRYTNERILELVDRLLAVPAEDAPVIVLQADEGPFPRRYDANEWRFDWHTATRDELREKFGILNAYHLPGVDPEAAGLRPDMTPVNTFRVIFNAYLGTDLPLLPDRIWAHRSQQAFYDFFDITERVR